ncbi:MAG: hypothetical protein GXP33_09185, partial [Spirochaetes bacterium]|nr:hypothetical protein [Spirochaetota bacterium]
YEAYRSGNFKRFVVADVDNELVSKVRENGGYYNINVAGKNGIKHERIGKIEIYNPLDSYGRNCIIRAAGESDEICTALPSVAFYDRGDASGVAGLTAEGLLLKGGVKSTIIYAAENNNHAAEIFKEILRKKLEGESNGGTKILSEVQCLNTVIGKMSGVIRDPAVIGELNLDRVVPGIDRAVLVEEFNRILISRINLPGFKRGISVFSEKDDLLPFEEAKLYGHNAVHALIAYLADLKGYVNIAEAGNDAWIMKTAHDAFIKESGEALIKKYGSTGDPLFTEEGFTNYAEDLLKRMVNRFLTDQVERVGRDRPRKLGIDDRIYGTMVLALMYGINPYNMALGAASGIVSMIRRKDPGPHNDLKLPESANDLSFNDIESILGSLWGRIPEKDTAFRYKNELINLTWDGYRRLKDKGLI